MARSAGIPLATDEAEAAVDATIDHEERRWPVLYSALFVVTSSVLLWALIIGGIHWLLA